MPVPVAATLSLQQVLAGGANVFAVTAGTTPFEKERTCCRDMARCEGAGQCSDAALGRHRGTHPWSAIARLGIVAARDLDLGGGFCNASL